LHTAQQRRERCGVAKRACPPFERSREELAKTEREARGYPSASPLTSKLLLGVIAYRNL
jgi:hypothetical protein